MLKEKDHDLLEIDKKPCSIKQGCAGHNMIIVILKRDLPLDAESKSIKFSAICLIGKWCLIVYGMHVVFGIVFLVKLFIK